MAWVAVDKQNKAWIHSSKPIRISEDEVGYWLPKSYRDSFIEVTIDDANYLANQKLTWEDEPVKLE